MKNPLQKEFDQLEFYLKKGNIVEPSVSQKGIYWHVDHCLRILEGIPEMMRQSDKKDYQPKSSLMKFVVMTFGWIPRGKGKSPKNVLPDEEKLDAQSIDRRSDQAFHQVVSIHKLPEWSYMRHPLFGSLNKDEAIKFLGIHTRHHLKIMRDIVKAHKA